MILSLRLSITSTYFNYTVELRIDIFVYNLKIFRVLTAAVGNNLTKRST